jgi:hypothetical protein
MGPAFILLTTITWLIVPPHTPIAAPVPVPTGTTARILITEAGPTQAGLPPKPVTTGRGVVRGHATSADETARLDPAVRLATGPECLEQRCGRPR